jgi:hypothetical protein
VDHLDPFAAEHLVEAGAELAVAVVDQEPRPLEEAGKAEIARLLRDPAAGRVGCAAGEVDAAASELDEEQLLGAWVAIAARADVIVGVGGRRR